MGNRLHRRALKNAAAKRLRQMVQRLYSLRPNWREEDRERVPLEKPVFWGYRRHLILRKDIASRKEAKRLLELLAIVQKEEDCRRKDFKRWNKDTHRWEEWNHTPRKLAPGEYRKLSANIQCFFERFVHDRLGLRYRVINPWWFESRRRKLYLTHRFLPNVEREREVAYLDQQFEQGQLWQRYRKIKSRSKGKWKHWDTRRRQLVDARDRRAIEDALQIFAYGELAQERGEEVNTHA